MRRAGYLAVAAAAVLWAFGGTYARTLIDKGVSPLEISEARAWFAALVLGSISRPRQWKAIDVPFGLSIAVANYTYYRAIQSLPVAVAIVIQYTAPALVVVWVALAQRKTPSKRTGVAVVAAIAGVALLAELPKTHLTLDGIGLLAASASAIAFASYIVLGETIRKTTTPTQALAKGFAVASVAWLVVQIPRGWPHTLGHHAGGIAIIVVAATIVPFLLFIWGLGHIDASKAGITSTLEPLSAALLAWVWLHQSLGAMQLAGGAMVLAGVGLVQTERPPRLSAAT